MTEQQLRKAMFSVYNAITNYIEGNGYISYDDMKDITKKLVEEEVGNHFGSE